MNQEHIDNIKSCNRILFLESGDIEEYEVEVNGIALSDESAYFSFDEITVDGRGIFHLDCYGYGMPKLAFKPYTTRKPSRIDLFSGIGGCASIQSERWEGLGER
jgi:hypothetical protein